MVPAPPGVAHLHQGPVEHHPHVAVEGTPREGHPLVVQEEAEVAEEPPSSHRGAVVLVEPEATVEEMLVGKGRQMCSTSLTPSAARPTTNRIGDPSPSPSSLYSRGPTIPVTMVTVMTPWSFHKILMGSSGSRCTKRYLAM